MRAAVQDGYGGPEVLAVREVPEPVLRPGDALVRVEACGLNSADWRLVAGEPRVVRLAFGLRRPRDPVAGTTVVGVVERLAEGASPPDGVRPGARVMAEVSRGGLAELARVPVARLVPVPDGVRVEAAAALPLAGTTALQGLRAGRLASGQRALVDGASGGVGHLALQLARAAGAAVTAVTGPRTLELVRSLGADEVVDRTSEQPEGHFDLVLDAAGHRPLRQVRRLLAPGGTYVAVGAGEGGPVLGPLLGPLPRTAAVAVGGLGRPYRMVPLVAKADARDLRELARLVSAGAVRPVVDRSYPLDDVVAAVRHVATGPVAGKVVVLVGG